MFKRKYRIIKRTFPSGKVEFVPQCGLLWHWVSWTRPVLIGADAEVVFSSFEEANLFILKKKTPIKEEVVG